ncbi:MAG: hypothetical protein V4713_12250 [Pseudomonadota bacterium]
MSQLTQFLTDTATFHRRHKTVAVMVWLTSLIAAAVLTVPHRSSDLFAFSLITTILTTLAWHVLTRYEKNLEARIAATDGGPVWQVQINGVTVGEIKDGDYASIRQTVFYDSRLYVAQFLDFWNVSMRVVDYLLTTIPMVVFWLAIGCFIFAPDLFAQALVVIQKVTPVQVAASIPLLVQFLFLVSLLNFGVHLGIGRPFGFVNHFDQACGYRVRRAVMCAADGEVSLYRIENGTYIAPNELATIGTKR